MAGTVACNNELKRLMIESEDESCYVIIWAITWATMLARVWGSMIEYIGGGGAGWFKDEVMLEL